MNPNTSTREEYTIGLTGIPLPSNNVASEWKELAEQLRTLLDKLAHHPAMAPNLQQPFMTPAASKNSVYFSWDFVGRTLAMLYRVDPTLEDLSAKESDEWDDVRGRAVYAGMLITDEMKGALDVMTETVYPGQKGQHPAFGEEILRLGRELCGTDGGDATEASPLRMKEEKEETATAEA